MDARCNMQEQTMSSRWYLVVTISNQVSNKTYPCPPTITPHPRGRVLQVTVVLHARDRWVGKLHNLGNGKFR